jgi:hypothetical protein
MYATTDSPLHGRQAIPRHWLPILLLALAAACGRPSGSTTCGIAAVAGPTLLLSQFGTPGQTLSLPPDALPAKLPVRVVAGGAYRGVVGRTGTEWTIGMEGTLPEGLKPAFGVLVIDPAAAARGVMLYESAPIRGAPKIGTVTLGAERVIPLIGIQLDPRKFEDPHCPFFPDSVLQ